MRQSIVAGNWKMNATSRFAVDLAQQVSLHAKNLDNVEVILCPPSVYISTVQQQAEHVKVAAQNVHFEESGAYTGELSVSMLQDVGCEYVLVGHSERRASFSETNELVARKVAAIIKKSLVPILCVGESLAQRKSGKAFEIVKQQVLSALTALDLAGKDVVVAYEPIWAIGTGETASPAQAQEMHAYIRAVIARQISENVANKTRILYGGSVNALTASMLFSQPDIDGGLIGGASLKVEDFKIICSAAAK